MLEVIKNRRSVRFYKNEPVPDELIDAVIQAGFCAPSAHGKRPWHVVVLKDPESRKKIANTHKWTKQIGFAPVALVVCVDKNSFEHFWVDDASAFMTTMLFEATNLGLGSCWVGIKGVIVDDVNVEAVVREVCNIPDNMGVLGITPLGYAARYPGPHKPSIPEGRVHYEKF